MMAQLMILLPFMQSLATGLDLPLDREEEERISENIRSKREQANQNQDSPECTASEKPGHDPHQMLFLAALTVLAVSQS